MSFRDNLKYATHKREPVQFRELHLISLRSTMRLFNFLFTWRTVLYVQTLGRECEMGMAGATVQLAADIKLSAIKPPGTYISYDSYVLDKYVCRVLGIHIYVLGSEYERL